MTIGDWTQRIRETESDAPGYLEDSARILIRNEINLGCTASWPESYLLRYLLY